jgi:hypothetical protein
MKVVGCDSHPNLQQVAAFDPETGELTELVRKPSGKTSCARVPLGILTPWQCLHTNRGGHPVFWEYPNLDDHLNPIHFPSHRTKRRDFLWKSARKRILRVL